MRDTIHRANKQEGNPVSYSDIAGKILNIDSLEEKAAEAILAPLLESNGSEKGAKEALKAAKERLKANGAGMAKNFLPDTTFSVVDIETTGGRAPQHRVTELAAVKLQDGEIVDEYHQLVNPGREIPWSVVRLTGITDAMLVDQPELTEVLPSFLDFLGDSASYAISLFVLSLAMKWRTGAAMVKGVSMGLFGLWVVGATIWSFIVTGKPSAVIMGSIGMLALIANVFSAFLLYRFREGDANMRSVWLCSRNDAISNIAVMIAASGVFYTGQNWPDLLVAIIMAGLALFASFQVIRHARQEWRQTNDQGSTIT